jgi:hypothetical protein
MWSRVPGGSTLLLVRRDAMAMAVQKTITKPSDRHSGRELGGRLLDVAFAGEPGRERIPSAARNTIPQLPS